MSCNDPDPPRKSAGGGAIVGIAVAMSSLCLLSKILIAAGVFGLAGGLLSGPRAVLIGVGLISGATFAAVRSYRRRKSRPPA